MIGGVTGDWRLVVLLEIVSYSAVEAPPIIYYNIQ
jgi:hypothetical protein